MESPSSSSQQMLVSSPSLGCFVLLQVLLCSHKSCEFMCVKAMSWEASALLFHMYTSFGFVCFGPSSLIIFAPCLMECDKCPTLQQEFLSLLLSSCWPDVSLCINHHLMQKEGTTVIPHSIGDICQTGLGGVHNLVSSSSRLVNTSQFSEPVAEENPNHTASVSSENLPRLRIDTHATNIWTYGQKACFISPKLLLGEICTSNLETI